MIVYRNEKERGKGWYAGPWNSDLSVSLGYANIGIDEPHLHREITEIYLVASGDAFVRVEGREILLSAGDVLVVEPGEAHTFTQSMEDYFHFVIHVPGLSGKEAQDEKIPVERSQLGL